MDENMRPIGAIIPQIQHGVAAASQSSRGGITPVPPEPTLSAETRWVLDRFTSPHVDIGFSWDLITPEAKAEAQAAQAAVESRTREATYDDWHALLLTVALSTANAPSTRRDPTRPDRPSPFEASVAAIHEAMGYVPICALHEAKRELMLEEYFPKANAVNRILSPHTRRAMGLRAAISRVATGKAHVPHRAMVRTPEEIAAVKATAAAFAAEMREKERAGIKARLSERVRSVVINPRTRAAAERQSRGEPLTEMEMEAEQDARLLPILVDAIIRLEQEIATLRAQGVDEVGLSARRVHKEAFEARVEFLRKKVKLRAYEERRA